jgi:hypothetical protein
MGAAKIPEKITERYYDPVMSGPSLYINGPVDGPKGNLVEEVAKLRRENEYLKSRDYHKL